MAISNMYAAISLESCRRALKQLPHAQSQDVVDPVHFALSSTPMTPQRGHWVWFEFKDCIIPDKKDFLLQNICPTTRSRDR